MSKVGAGDVRRSAARKRGAFTPSARERKSRAAQGLKFWIFFSEIRFKLEKRPVCGFEGFQGGVLCSLKDLSLLELLLLLWLLKRLLPFPLSLSQRRRKKEGERKKERVRERE